MAEQQTEEDPTMEPAVAMVWVTVVAVAAPVEVFVLEVDRGTKNDLGNMERLEVRTFG